MSEAKDEKKAEGAPAAAPKSSKLLPALVGLNSLLLVGVMAFLVMQMRQGSHPPPAEHAEAAGEHDEAEPDAKPEKAEKPEKAKAKDEPAEEKAGEGEEGKAKSRQPIAGLGPLVKISDFVIHLRNPEIDRYARMSFDVEVIADSDKDSLNAHMPRVRDAFISYLSDRTLEELQGAAGLGRTKDALQTKLRDLVPEARVRNLYISDFVVQ